MDQWIALAKRLGFTQLDLHGGNPFRFGDYCLDPKQYPQGADSLQKVLDRLHAAGVKVGLHTLFISHR